MLLIAGLGNPGPKYAQNRHNIGFMAVDVLAQALGAGSWKRQFASDWAEARLGAERVVFIKPGSFMNLSGQPIGEAMRFLKLTPDDVLVIHDELDLPPGKLRMKTAGGHAGHNGLRSLHQHIGEGYHRMRLGIGHPGDKNLVAAYVLHDFAKADQLWLQPLMAAIAAEGAKLLTRDWAGFANGVALRLNPPAIRTAKTPV